MALVDIVNVSTRLLDPTMLTVLVMAVVMAVVTVPALDANQFSIIGTRDRHVYLHLPDAFITPNLSFTLFSRDRSA